MKKYILLLALCGASFACKNNDAPSSVDSDVAATGSSAEASGDAVVDGDEKAADAAADAAAAEAAADDTVEEGADDGAEPGGVGEGASAATLASETTLTSAGAKPHRVLSFDLSKLTPETAVHTTDITTKVMGQNMIMPRIVSTFSTRDLSLKDGLLSVTLEMSDQRFEKRADDQLHNMLVQSMKEAAPSGGMTVSFSADKHGQTTNVRVLSTNDDTQEAMSTAVGNIRSMSNIFPTEAVGVGATWTTKTQADLGEALSMEVTAYNTLEQLSRDEAVIVVRYEAPDFLKALGAETLEEMGGAKVTSGALTGGTRSVVRFDSLLANIEQNMDVTMELEIEGQKTKAEIQMKMTVKTTN